MLVNRGKTALQVPPHISPISPPYLPHISLVNRGKTALQVPLKAPPTSPHISPYLPCISLQVQLKVPPELHGNLEFIPTMGFVQARANFKVRTERH